MLSVITFHLDFLVTCFPLPPTPCCFGTPGIASLGTLGTESLGMVLALPRWALGLVSVMWHFPQVVLLTEGINKVAGTQRMSMCETSLGDSETA